MTKYLWPSIAQLFTFVVVFGGVALFEVYYLDRCDPKFGCWGSVEFTFFLSLIPAIISAFTMATIVAFLNYFFVQRSDRFYIKGTLLAGLISSTSLLLFWELNYPSHYLLPTALLAPSLINLGVIFIALKYQRD